MYELLQTLFIGTCSIRGFHIHIYFSAVQLNAKLTDGQANWNVLHLPTHQPDSRLCCSKFFSWPPRYCHNVAPLHLSALNCLSWFVSSGTLSSSQGQQQSIVRKYILELPAERSKCLRWKQRWGQRQKYNSMVGNGSDPNLNRAIQAQPLPGGKLLELAAKPWTTAYVGFGAAWLVPGSQLIVSWVSWLALLNYPDP